MIEEVRRQFRDIPALKAALEVMRKNNSDMSKASAADRKIFDAADGVAEYDKCVEISTQASIREMVLPGLLAIIVPVLVGFGGKWFGIGGAEMLGGLLAGVTTCGVLMAIFQSNAGGAWDNAKKMIEEQGKKGTDAHKAAVVGDTVGDPFKDTSGPSLNILLKLMSVVALVIAPSLVPVNASESTSEMPVKTEMVSEAKDTSKGVISLTVGDESEKIKVSTYFTKNEKGFEVGFKSKGIGSKTSKNPILSSRILAFNSTSVEKSVNGIFVAKGELMYESGSMPVTFEFKTDDMIIGEIKIK
jgi:K(+)-stimulated pyrophosphate-energized sodium pump